MLRLALGEVVLEPDESALILLELLLFEGHLDLLLVLQLSLPLDQLHLSPPDLELPLLEPTLHEVAQVDRPLLDLFQGFSQLLLLTQLLLQVGSLALQLPTLLIQLVLVLTLLRLQLSLVMNLQLQTLTSQGLLMSF